MTTHFLSVGYTQRLIKIAMCVGDNITVDKPNKHYFDKVINSQKSC